MSNETDPDLSGWQLAKHIAAGLPFGLFLGFCVGGLVYTVFLSTFPVVRTSFLTSGSLLKLYHGIAVLIAVYVGVCVTGFWIWHAEDTSTGIRLSEAYTDE